MIQTQKAEIPDDSGDQAKLIFERDGGEKVLSQVLDPGRRGIQVRKPRPRGERERIVASDQGDARPGIRCGQRMSILAFVTDQLSIGRILDYLGLHEPEQSKPPPPPEVLRVAEHGEGWGVPSS